MRKWILRILAVLSGLWILSPLHAAVLGTADAGKHVAFFPDAGNIKWIDHLDNQDTINQNWTSSSGTSGTASIQNIAGTSVAAILATPPSLTQFAYVQTQEIRCDVDQYNLLEVSVTDVLTAAWKISLVDTVGNEFPLSEKDQETGATGMFTFRYAQKAGWVGSGEKSFFVRVYIKRIDANPAKISLDYVTVFRENAGNVFRNVVWRDEFNGAPNKSVVAWYDSANTNWSNMARMTYDANGTRAHIASVDSVGKWGKVVGPSVMIDTTRAHKIAFAVSAVDTDSALVDIMYKDPADPRPEYQQKRIFFQDNQYIPQPISEAEKDKYRFRKENIYTFDLKSGAGWKEGMGIKELFYEITVEGESGKSVDVDWVMIYESDISFQEVAPRFATQPVALPNPFMPAHDHKTLFRCNDSTQGATIRIFNLKGQKVKHFTDEVGSANWDGTDDLGRLCEGGLYLFQIELPGQRKRLSGQVVLIK